MGRRRGHARRGGSVALSLALWLACALVLPACSSCGKSSSPAGSSSAAPVALEPVAAPASLLADVYMPHPTTTWGSFREAVSGPILLMPASYQMLATTLLGLSPQIAGLLDADVPVVGAIVADEAGQPQLVVGMHVRDPGELVANLVTGSDAKFRASTDASGVQLLEPVPGKAANDMHLGVVGNYLVASADAEALGRAAPYVARTLPKRTMPEGGLVVVANHKALSGPLASRVQKAWQTYRDNLVESDKVLRSQHGGRAPDFADPTAAVLGAGAAVDSVVEVLRTTEELRLVVDPLEGRVEARLELVPAKSGAAAELVEGMAVGPMNEAAKLPPSAGLAIESRTTKASREKSAQTTGDALAKLFGDRLVAADRKKLDGVLADLAAGRGDDAAFAVVSGGAGPGLVMRSTTTDGAVFQRAVKAGLSLLAVPAFSAPLQRFVGKVGVKLSATRVDGVDGKVQRALITIKQSGSAPVRPAATGSGPTKIEALWTVSGGVAYGVLGSQAGPLFDELFSAGASTGKSLAAVAPTAQAAQRVGSSATFAVLADPQKLGIAPAQGKGPVAPIVLAIGRADQHGWLRLELPQVALRGMLRFAMQLGRR